MPTKITAIFENPKDPDAFEEGQSELLELAKGLPGVQRVESSKVFPKEDGSPTPAYRLLDLYFADYVAASEAAKPEHAGAFVGKVAELGTDGFRLVFADVEES